ncbi:FAD-dependent oxidoreductase [Streptomonospora sediminis]
MRSQPTAQARQPESTSVLVVGGGLAGLSTALFLAWHGVPAVLVERHQGSSPHPRAIGYHRRTLELYRSVGLAELIPQVPPGAQVRRRRVESLTGRWFEEMHWQSGDAPAPATEYSPCGKAQIAQDTLEPILRGRAAELGADLRLGTELVSFEQDGHGAGVEALIRNRADGTAHELRAEYLVAADGNRSPVRESLGIGRSGRGGIGVMRSVLFRSPVMDQAPRGGIHQFQIDQPGLKGMLSDYRDGRSLLMLHEDVDRDEEALLGLIAQALGRPDPDAEIITTGRWDLTFSIADRYRQGRIFLAGDAAHTLPPSRGGYGANVGIEDAHNLAWKLAAVISGEAGPGLLETYDAERRPVAWLCHDQIIAHNDGHVSEAGTRGAALSDDAMELGLLYRSDAVLGAGAQPPPAARPDEWAGRPGTRAPHVWLDRGGERLSSLDLFQQGWVLLTEDPRWAAAADRAAARPGPTAACRVLGAGLAPQVPDAFRRAFGLTRSGAVLVRPDGYIAWRCTEAPAVDSELAEAVGSALQLASCLAGAHAPSGAA